MKESEATDRFLKKYGPVNTLRLLGWGYKLDTAGEEWFREHVSRQQLAFIQHQFEEAKVPWAPGAIEWPKIMRAGKKALDNARALDARTQAWNERTQAAAKAARRKRRTV